MFAYRAGSNKLFRLSNVAIASSKAIPYGRKFLVPSASRLSTLIDQKVLGDEARYIRDRELKLAEERRAKLEQILSLEDSHAEKAELLELLEKKSGPTSVISKLGLDDWKLAVPVGLLVGMPALYNEVLVINAEAQLAACFFLFCSTVYVQLGPTISKFFEDYSNNIAVEVSKVDTAIESQLKSAIIADEAVLTLVEDYKDIYALEDGLAVAQAELLNVAAEQKYREDVLKKLDSLYALEEGASVAIRSRMIKSVKNQVVTTFQKDKAAQDAALAQAIAVLSAGPGAKIGKDIVGDVFASSVKSYREAYAKQPAGSDEILVQLEKDIAAVAVPPVVATKGGNVYFL